MRTKNVATKKKVQKTMLDSSDTTIFTVLKVIMKTIKVKTNVNTNTFIDRSTGEVLEVEEDVKHTKIVVDSRRDFVMLSVPILGLLDGLDNTSVKVLIWCALNAQYNKNMITLTKPWCEEITKEFNISYQTIKNSIYKLSKNKALIALGSGTYRVNPRYFWKGQTSEKLKTMRHIVEIECPRAND